MVFCGLTFPDDSLERHLTKRIRYGHIKNRKEYLEKIRNTIEYADKFYILRQLADCKDKLIFFNSKDNWVVIVLLEERIILTCFLLDEAEDIISYYQNKNYDLYLREDCKKGSLQEVKQDENDKYWKIIKEIRDRC